MEAARAHDLHDLALKLDASQENVRNWDKGRLVPDKWLREAELRFGVPVDELRHLNQSGAVMTQTEVVERSRQIGALSDSSATAPAVSHSRHEPRDEAGDLARARFDVALAAGHPDGWVLPLTGDGQPLVTNGLIAPQTTSLARPLVLPVTIGRAHREFQVIPQLTRPALAGRPAASTRSTRMGDATADLAGSMAFDRAWLREHLGRDGGGFISVSVSGDSMEPALFDGDSIIIDTLVDRVDASGVYVIRLGVDLLVKRIQRKLDGALVISSDNNKYAPEELPASRAGELRVEGRLVWPRLR